MTPPGDSKMTDTKSALHELEEVIASLDDRADVDDGQPNEAMRHSITLNAVHQTLTAALAALERAVEGRYAEIVMYKALVEKLQGEKAKAESALAERKDWICPETYALTLQAVAIEADRATKAESRARELEAAVRRQIDNIDRWLLTDEPASPDESKSIYSQLKAALSAAGDGNA